MKITKKTILIIAIIVAVVAYLWWKKRQADTVTGELPASPDMSVKGILTAIGADSTVKTYVTSMVPKIAANAEWKAKVASQAEAEDITYNQAAVLNALWLMYENKKLDWASFDKLTSKVRDL